MSPDPQQPLTLSSPSGGTDRHLWDGLTVNLGLIAQHLGRRNAENFAHLAQPAWCHGIFPLLVFLNLLKGNTHSVTQLRLAQPTRDPEPPKMADRPYPLHALPKSVTCPTRRSVQIRDMRRLPKCLADIPGTALVAAESCY
jgi:hypothetical protein